MPTSGFILKRESDGAPVLSHTTMGQYIITTNEQLAEFNTAQTVVDAWRDLINANVPTSQVVGTRPHKRLP